MWLRIVRQQSVLMVWIWFIPPWLTVEKIPLREWRTSIEDYPSRRLKYSFSYSFISVTRVNRDEYNRTHLSESLYPIVLSFLRMLTLNLTFSTSVESAEPHKALGRISGFWLGWHLDKVNPLHCNCVHVSDYRFSARVVRLHKLDANQAGLDDAQTIFLGGKWSAIYYLCTADINITSIGQQTLNITVRVHSTTPSFTLIHISFSSHYLQALKRERSLFPTFVRWLKDYGWGVRW